MGYLSMTRIRGSPTGLAHLSNIPRSMTERGRVARNEALYDWGRGRNGRNVLYPQSRTQARAQARKKRGEAPRPDQARLKSQSLSLRMCDYDYGRTQQTKLGICSQSAL
jgi:hypothetical protein